MSTYSKDQTTPERLFDDTGQLVYAAGDKVGANEDRTLYVEADLVVKQREDETFGLPNTSARGSFDSTADLHPQQAEGLALTPAETVIEKSRRGGSGRTPSTVDAALSDGEGQTAATPTTAPSSV